MTIIYRRIIYLAFITIFLVSAPLIILYTMGYRYNFTKGRVQKTGIIRITSVPGGADINLNGVKFDQSQTPARIERLLPGDYEIRLSKGGYYDWQKKLPVYENGTTFAEKIILWKKASPVSLASAAASSWLMSPDKNIVAFESGDGNVSLLDINSGIFGETSGGKIETITANGGYDSLRLDSFSPSGRYVLAEAVKNGKSSYFLIDTLAKNSKKLPGQDYASVKWEASGDKLYALDKNGLLSSIDLASLKLQTAVKALAADDFFISNKNLYFISAGVLNKRTLTDSSYFPIEKIDCPNCRIRDIRNNRLIAMSDAGDLSIIDLNRQIKTINAKAVKLDWLNYVSLAYHNDYEIYIYNFSKTDPELITRLGSPIASAVWHPNGRHLIFSSGGKINIIELDNRELRNIITVADADASDISVDRAGNNIFYSAGEAGIFKLNIQ